MGTRTAKNTYKQGQTHVQWGNCFYKQVSDTQTQVCLKAGGGSEKSRFWVQKRRLSTLTANAACQLNVLGHDRHTLGVDRAQVGVLKTGQPGRPRLPPAVP